MMNSATAHLSATDNRHDIKLLLTTSANE